MNASFDFSRMENLLQGIQGALIGAGEKGDIRELITQEAKLFSWEASKKLGPKNQAAGKRKIERELRGQFHPMVNSQTGDAWDVFDGSQAGTGDVRWLYAGPTYLVGVRRQDYGPDMSESVLEKTYYQNRGTQRGKAWQDQGQLLGKQVYRGRDGHLRKRSRYKASHGSQHVIILNRIAIQKNRFNALVKKISARVGRMRATLAYTAFELGYKKVPAWVKRHFQSVAADGKAIFNRTRLNDPTRPAIVFGSRATGITRFKAEIQAVRQTRDRKLAKRLRLILDGYVKDHKAGKPPRRHAKDTEEFE